MDEVPETETVDQPRVFIAIPTGLSKSYALTYMVAALEQLEWDNLELHWAVSDTHHEEVDVYVNRIRDHMKASLFKHPCAIHRVPLNNEERVTPYVPIVKNRQHLRSLFLDSECDYLFIVGGDNPPWRTAVTRLMAWDVDVAMGVSYQRPGRDQKNPEAVYPMVWTYAWNMRDLEKFHLEDKVLNQFRKAFLNATLLLPVFIDPNWKRKKRIYGVTGGDGNCLIKRKVVEHVPWIQPGEWTGTGGNLLGAVIGAGNPGYHSEDIHWFNNVNFLGFTTVCDMKYHVMHMHEEDGAVY